MWITLYRRSTMSPSTAMKTSSPCDRKTFFGSPGLLAKPKNFKLMGGGGGGGGGAGGPIGPVLSITAGATGAGISTCATKILRPLPAYLVCSVCANRRKSNVGSRRSCAAGRSLPLRPMVFLALPATVVAGCAAVTGAEGPLTNSYARISRAIAPRALAQTTFDLFSDPMFTLASHLLESLEFHLQLDRTILLSERNAVDDEEHLGALQAVQKLCQRLVVALNRGFHFHPAQPHGLGIVPLVLRRLDFYVRLFGQILKSLGHFGIMSGEAISVEVVNLLRRNRNLFVETVERLHLPVLRRKLRAQLIQVLLALGGRSHEGRDQKDAGQRTDTGQHADRDFEFPPGFPKIGH